METIFRTRHKLIETQLSAARKNKKYKKKMTNLETFVMQSLPQYKEVRWQNVALGISNPRSTLSVFENTDVPIFRTTHRLDELELQSKMKSPLESSTRTKFLTTIQNRKDILDFKGESEKEGVECLRISQLKGVQARAINTISHRTVQRPRTPVTAQLEPAAARVTQENRQNSPKNSETTAGLALSEINSLQDVAGRDAVRF